VDGFGCSWWHVVCCFVHSLIVENAWKIEAMRHLSVCLLVVTVLGTASGCSLIDRLFLINADSPYSHHYGGCPAGCEDGCEQCNEAPCTGCQSGLCPSGGCKDGFCRLGKNCNACSACADGRCQERHVGRYGGLGRHHLTPEEECELRGSDYGATCPPGPPSGAVAYPYYTTRGPRDFLAKCPPSIGP
jgi:hypothetical protein